GSPTVQVASTSVSGSRGNRDHSLMFLVGTTAQMVMDDGSTQELSSMDVRITEYTVGPAGPQRMPADLPPTSTYTLAFEASIDEAIAAGAQSVEFSQPVVHYVDNFLNVSVGT